MTLQAAYVHAMWEHTNLDDTEEVQTLFFIAKDIVKGTRAVDDFFLALDCLLCVQKAIQGGSPHSTRDLSRIYHEIYHVYHGFITKIITLCGERTGRGVCAAKPPHMLLSRDDDVSRRGRATVTGAAAGARRLSSLVSNV